MKEVSTVATESAKKERPEHQDRQPGIESIMDPKPKYIDESYRPSGKLEGKAALITGGDSGIGRAVAILFAKEGADVSIVYKEEHEDAKETRKHVENTGRKCLLISGDLREEEFCNQTIRKTVEGFGRLDILVNNAGIHFPTASIKEISTFQLDLTFKTNIYPMYYLTKAALNHFKRGSVIINTASVTAYTGHELLLDYAASKGAVVSFTRSLAMSLADKGIRVNAVAPGPVWTPLITSFPQKEIDKFGDDTPMGRAGEPYEIAPSFLFLASSDSAYMTGQVLHPNGGWIVNG